MNKEGGKMLGKLADLAGKATGKATVYLSKAPLMHKAKAYSDDKAIAHLESEYRPGGFLLINDKVVPVLQMEVQGNQAEFDLADSNNKHKLSMERPLKIKNISISQAVALGWRIKHHKRWCWDNKATSKMKAEYAEAIRQIAIKLSVKEKRECLLESMMFPY
ncbi:MAG: hypothetical protein V1801_00465 [Candidatus Falkowbacteria bacterium]